MNDNHVCPARNVYRQGINVLIHVIFWLCSPTSSGVSLQVKATGDDTKHTVTLNEITDFSWFEYCLKHLG